MSLTDDSFAPNDHWHSITLPTYCLSFLLSPKKHATAAPLGYLRLSSPAQPAASSPALPYLALSPTIHTNRIHPIHNLPPSSSPTDSAPPHPISQSTSAAPSPAPSPFRPSTQDVDTTYICTYIRVLPCRSAPTPTPTHPTRKPCLYVVNPYSRVRAASACTTHTSARPPASIRVSST